MENDVKKMLEKLYEQTQVTGNTEQNIDTQTTENSIHSDSDIKDMLRKQFSATDEQVIEESHSDEESFSTSDFQTVDDELDDEDFAQEEITENPVEEALDNKEETIIEDIIEEVLDETEVIVDELVEEMSAEEVDEAVEEIFDGHSEDIVEEATEKPTIETIEENVSINDVEPFVEEPTRAFEVTDIIENDIEDSVQEDVIEVVSKSVEDDEEPIFEESINYDDVLEGQQGTVFNEFVEDFTGDLDDVVFEAEITDSHAPNKQYTIFEDWEQLMKDKQYETAEEGIIPPTQEELAHSAEIASRAAMGKTDYFTPVVEDTNLDAVDIALMVALGGESELNQTVGFEKIRQAVHDATENETETLKDQKIYGFCGEEYSSATQNTKIKRQYKKDKINVILKMSATAILALTLFVYEIMGWSGFEFDGLLSTAENPALHVLAGLQILFVCVAISFDKFIKLFKNIFSFTSISFMGAIIASVLSILHDTLILTTAYADPGATLHTIPAVLLLIGLIYDYFDVSQQSGVFNIISSVDKKLVLEPYGKLRVDEDDEDADIIDKDSYCISRVSTVSKYFARNAKSTEGMTRKIVSLVLCFSVALCVMMVLLLMNKDPGTIGLSFIITLSFTLLCASIFESEFAFFTVFGVLKKYKTGIIGKSSVSEYGKCNIVYFDDFNIFNKKSVRTKGLKLYDNNEIYRILYHTQAVFSKIGGPLKGVFEFATSEMTHSKSVEVKEITQEGLIARVDGRTIVHIGTGAFMKRQGIHPSYTNADLKLEETGEESIMFIALNGKLGAKLYVTYQFSAEFEKLARKLAARGVGIGIRSTDPNINNKWARKYGEAKKFAISIVRPTLKEIKSNEKSIEGGVVSAKNVRALSEALMMCIKLNDFEEIISKVRAVSIVLVAILSFALVLFSQITAVSMLVMMLANALCASIMVLLTYFYLKR